MHIACDGSYMLLYECSEFSGFIYSDIYQIVQIVKIASFIDYYTENLVDIRIKKNSRELETLAAMKRCSAAFL